MHLTAIIVAAGESRRMGFNKMFADLDGRPVLERTVAAFERCGAVDDIIIISNPKRQKDLMRVIAEGGFEKVSHIAPGGETRRDSVWNGIRDLKENCQFVAVHDGARPWISKEQIVRVLDAAVEHGAAASAHQITDTVKRADADGRVTAAIEREGLWAMETPQIFRVDLIKSAYEKVIADDLPVTDEVSAVEHLGQPVFVVANDTRNAKVTFPADLEIPAPKK